MDIPAAQQNRETPAPVLDPELVEGYHDLVISDPQIAELLVRTSHGNGEFPEVEAGHVLHSEGMAALLPIGRGNSAD